MSMSDPCLIRSRGPSGEPVVRLGMPLLDEYLEFLGSNTAFANAELRFPFIEAMLTPLGVLGGVRGVFFAGMGGAHFDGQPFTWWKTGSSVETPVIGLTDPDRLTGLQQPILGPKTTVSGFRLIDARASYGLGLETFLIGFPVHFDWSWRTLLNKDYEDVVFALQGGHSAFRKPKFALWIGYDF